MSEGDGMMERGEKGLGLVVDERVGVSREWNEEGRWE
jgi:hypothetical protein